MSDVLTYSINPRFAEGTEPFYKNLLDSGSTTDTQALDIFDACKARVQAAPAREKDDKAYSDYFPRYIFTTNAKLSQKFENHLSEWHKKINPFSQPEKMYQIRAYKKIIRMGKKALPLFFNKLMQECDEPDFLFVALKKITGADPVPENLKGNMPEVSKRWISYLYESIA